MPPQPKTPSPLPISNLDQRNQNKSKKMNKEINPDLENRKRKKNKARNQENPNGNGRLQEPDDEQPVCDKRQETDEKKKTNTKNKQVSQDDEKANSSDDEKPLDNQKRKRDKRKKRESKNKEVYQSKNDSDQDRDNHTKKKDKGKSKKSIPADENENDLKGAASDHIHEKVKNRSPGKENEREDSTSSQEAGEERAKVREQSRRDCLKRGASSAETIDSSFSNTKPSPVGSVSEGTKLNSSPSLSTLSARTSLGSISSSSRNQTRQDINYVFAEPLDKKYECPVCCLVLRYPVQFEECGHRCCSSCLPELLRVAPRCPIDQRKVDRDKVYIDRTFQKELDQLAVKCSNVERGCPWAEILQHLTLHLDECEFAPISCPNGCDAEFERRFFHKHKTEDCVKRGIFCEFCNTEVAREDEEDHLKICDKFPVHCANGCKKRQIPRSELREHMEKECPKQKILCPFSEAGCDQKGTRKEMEKHMKQEPEVHLEMVSRALTTYRTTLDAHALVIDSHSDRLLNVEIKVESLEKLYGSQLVWKIDNYKEKLQDAKSGKKTTIFSPPFLTNRHGYKMALSACVYGDGKARGKFMSLFACICKGEYDSLLIWPFCHKVTFTLVDQCQDPAARRNISYTIKPNTCKENRPFLSRPVGERNASFGAQKFADLEVLKSRDFTRDDTMFIKVNVDSENMQLV